MQSTPGQGSCFFFSLPLQEATEPQVKAASQAAAALTDPQESSLQGCQVLAVDDAPINLELITEMLTQHGCTGLLACTRIHGILDMRAPFKLAVDEATNGKEAVEKFQSAPNKYQCILMDCNSENNKGCLIFFSCSFCAVPVMDGYQATRRIRSIEDDAGVVQPVRIVALTAYTLSSEVEKTRTVQP